MRVALQGRVLLWLFVLSGFSGLIYQSIWSHYLGLVLGHAAYAQALVLAIFMGGMALGAWLASRASVGWGQLLLRYAVLELVVGLCGLAFHPFFEGYIGLSQRSVLPALASPLAAHAYQWGTAAILILPQCVMLGMTFPLMSAAFLRLTPADDGQVLGGLYFSNSLGAALGALAAVFMLLPAVGMPGAMFTAGLINVVVALGAWAVWKTVAEPGTQPASADTGAAAAKEDRDPPALTRFLLVCAFATGATSFVYEIGWVRMLNTALGTTLHSFELMLAAFILGLAFGGRRVRQRSAQIVDAVGSTAWAQVMKGVCALLSVVVFAHSFQGIAWLMQALNRSDSGYDLFMAGSALVSLLVMFPAAYFAGMTLPLLTVALLRAGGSERRIGQVYASNTLGAIVGVLLAMYLLIPLLGVHGAVVVAALADCALGLALLARRQARSEQRMAVPLAIGVILTAVVASFVFGQVDPRTRLSGVFRFGQAALGEEVEIPYLRDGRTATVGFVTAPDGTAAISTNGKTDAALALDMAVAPTDDETTMIMAGVLPTLLHPAPAEIAVIGWGSGLTTHTLLGSPKPKLVETIEIEPAMVEAARLFGPRVARAYDDPRSTLRIDDARTVFAMGNRQYDVIVSEPSNPWVSGVASLFTREFYGFLRAHLKPDGMLVQWIQAYELDGPLFATMLGALLAEFPDSELYVTQSTDFIVVAHTHPGPAIDASVFAQEPLSSELARVHLHSPAHIALRRVGGGDVLRAYVRSYGAQPHSDYFPVVALNAPRSRFKGAEAIELLDIVDTGMPVAELLDGYVPQPYAAIAGDPVARFAFRKRIGYALAGRLRGEPDAVEFTGARVTLNALFALRDLSRTPLADRDLKMWTDHVASIVNQTLSSLTPQELDGVWIRPTWIDEQAQPPLVKDVLAALDAAARRDATRMLPTAIAVLEHPAEAMDAPLRNLMLVQAQLAAAVQGRFGEVLALENRHGATAGQRSYQRSFLLTWAQMRSTSSPTSMPKQIDAQTSQ